MVAAVQEWCHACGSPHVAAHCESKGCGWWRCMRCGSYGNEGKHFDVRARKAS